MKTSELTGPALDWAVAKCEGLVYQDGAWYKPATEWLAAWRIPVWSPSTDWSQGGPIIERERIKVAPNLSGSWHGQIRHEKAHLLVGHKVLDGWTNKHGPTPLIAAMRCYVSSKLGDEVDVPKELL